MAEVLSDYLAEMSGRPFVYGADDCATFVIGWLDRIHAAKAIDEWRWRYDSEDSCETFIRVFGGFVAIASEFLGKHYGLMPGAAPRAGNPVFATFKDTSAMGIRVDNERVAMRTKAGVLITSRVFVTHEWGPA